MVQKKTEPRFHVSKEKAREYVQLSIAKDWIGMSYGSEGWTGAKLDKTPLDIYDLNGQLLFYEYSILKGNSIVGLVKASASKILGSPVIQTQTGERTWDPQNAIKRAKGNVRKNYPNARITNAQLVCFSYPKIGVRVFIEDPKTGVESLIYDVASLSLVDRFGSDELEGFTSWSFYNDIADPESDRREKRWDLAENELEVARAEVPDLFREGFATIDRNKNLKAILKVSPEVISSIPFISQRIIQYCPHCSTHNCNSLHSQQTDVYCAVATGQMILDFYRYYYNQNDIAISMGTTSGGTGVYEQATGIRSLSKNCLEASIDTTAAWSEAKTQIDLNRPLKSGIPGHARACFGWKRQNIFVVGRIRPRRWLYILDPWPWNADLCQGGAVYWEDWDAVNHTNFMYVNHRTTSCT
jgi:hypothetical protein